MCASLTERHVWDKCCCRKWLVEKLAAEAAASIFLSRDVTLAEDVTNQRP
jgi:hypothetical protein